MKTEIETTKASKPDNPVKPKRILFRLIIAVLIAVTVLFPTYWFGFRKYMFRAKVRSLLSIHLDVYKPDADRQRALEEILRLSKKAVPVIVHELETNEKLTYSQKADITEILGNIKDTRAIGGLIRSVIEDKEHIENIKKTKVYGKMMEEANKAEQELRNYDKYISKTAESLGLIGYAKTVSLIRKQTKDKTDEGNYYRIFEIRVMGQLKIKEYVNELIETIKNISENSKIRSEAVKALGQIGDRSAVKPLIEALNYTGDIQLAAVIALGELKDQRAINPLIQLYNSPSFSFPAGLQRNIIYSLGEIGGREAEAELIKIYQTSPDIELRNSAKEAYKIMMKAQSKYGIK